MMDDRTRPGPALIAETVSRLMSVQADFADESAEVRQQHLLEELDRALSRLVPDERQPFLNDVLRRFPNWDVSDNGHAAAPAASSPVTGAETLPSDPELLTQRLIEAAADIPEGRRQALREQLAKAGLSASASPWPSDLAARLRLPESSAVTPDRALQVLTALLSSAEKIDDMAWKTLRQLDRQGVRRKPGELKDAIIKYLAGESASVQGDKSAARQAMNERVEMFRRLASSLIYELREIETIARQQAQRFCPEEIEKASDPKMFETLPTACWRTFKKLASDYDAAAIEREIRQRIAQHVEENLR